MSDKKIEKDKIIIIAVIILIVIFGGLYIFELMRGSVVLSRDSSASVSNPAPFENNNAGGVNVASVVVHVAGEVKAPGVYELKSGSRVLDALEMAGGPTEDADLGRINLAAYISDAQQIIIPKVPAEGESPAAVYDNAKKLVNINTADLRELMTLPGIGEVLAGSIIAYRERNGDFYDISEIKNVTRIGDRTFEQIQDLITVN